LSGAFGETKIGDLRHRRVAGAKDQAVFMKAAMSFSFKYMMRVANNPIAELKRQAK